MANISTPDNQRQNLFDSFKREQQELSDVANKQAGIQSDIYTRYKNQSDLIAQELDKLNNTAAPIIKDLQDTVIKRDENAQTPAIIRQLIGIVDPTQTVSYQTNKINDILQQLNVTEKQTELKRNALKALQESTRTSLEISRNLVGKEQDDVDRISKSIQAYNLMQDSAYQDTVRDAQQKDEDAILHMRETKDPRYLASPGLYEARLLELQRLRLGVKSATSEAAMKDLALTTAKNQLAIDNAVHSGDAKQVAALYDLPNINKADIEAAILKRKESEMAARRLKAESGSMDRSASVLTQETYLRGLPYTVVADASILIAQGKTGKQPIKTPYGIATVELTPDNKVNFVMPNGIGATIEAGLILKDRNNRTENVTKVVSDIINSVNIAKEVSTGLTSFDRFLGELAISTSGSKYIVDPVTGEQRLAVDPELTQLRDKVAENIAIINKSSVGDTYKVDAIKSQLLILKQEEDKLKEEIKKDLKEVNTPNARITASRLDGRRPDSADLGDHAIEVISRGNAFDINDGSLLKVVKQLNPIFENFDSVFGKTTFSTQDVQSTSTDNGNQITFTSGKAAQQSKRQNFFKELNKENPEGAVLNPNAEIAKQRRQTYLETAQETYAADMYKAALRLTIYKYQEEANAANYTVGAQTEMPSVILKDSYGVLSFNPSFTNGQQTNLTSIFQELDKRGLLNQVVSDLPSTYKAVVQRSFNNPEQTNSEMAVRSGILGSVTDVLRASQPMLQRNATALQEALKQNLANAVAETQMIQNNAVMQENLTNAEKRRLENSPKTKLLNPQGN